MIDILLATYNGGRFLREQLDSLLHQTERDFRVLIQDDGSTDGTAGILDAYAKEYPDNILLVDGPAHKRSPKGNFMSLLHESTADYIMFCDQDDIWDEDKIAVTISRMREGERVYGAACPLLVHTDLRVVGADLAPIAPSFLRYQRLDGDPKLSRLLAQNSVTGCTMMINRALAELMKKAPAEDMLMHDWWAALCAESMGNILFVDRPAISYRQHGKNQLGATGFNMVRDVKKAARDEAGIRKRIADTFSQAEAFINCYLDILPKDSAAVIMRYAMLPGLSKPGRMLALIRHGYLKKGFFRSLGQLYYC